MENLRKIIRQILKEYVEHSTALYNYDFDASPYEVSKKLNDIKNVGKKLDSNFLENIESLEVLSVNEKFGKLICEVGYPDGTVVLFYKSEKGTSGKEMGGWFPIPGFARNSFYLGQKKYPEGWFVKGSLEDISSRYGSKVFNYTADYLKANESEIF
jgi:hypothetical protein